MPTLAQIKCKVWQNEGESCDNGTALDPAYYFSQVELRQATASESSTGKKARSHQQQEEHANEGKLCHMETRLFRSSKKGSEEVGS